MQLNFYRFIFFVSSDGRLRIGDEIVNVNGQHLRGIQSHAAVQQMLANFVDNAVDLVIAHDELTTFAADHHQHHHNHHATPSLSNQRKSLNTNDLQQPLDLSSSSSSYLTRSINQLSFRASKRTDNVSTVNVQLDGTDQVDCSEHLHRNYQESRINRRGSSSLNRSLALTPLFNSSEYIPVYANRVMITNTISDDEKWQLLSRKRSEQLSDLVYPIIGDEQSLDNPDKIHRMHENETVYALCRPHNKNQPLSISRSTTSLLSNIEIAETECQSPYPKLEDDSIVPKHQSFLLQKSQTESCLPLAISQSSIAANNKNTQQLYIQSPAFTDVSEEGTNKCEETISVQDNDEGVSYVEGNL